MHEGEQLSADTWQPLNVRQRCFVNNLVGNKKPVRVFEHGSLKITDMEAMSGRPGGRKGTLEWRIGDAFSSPLIPAPNLSVPQVWILEAKTNTLTLSKHQLF